MQRYRWTIALACLFAATAGEDAYAIGDSGGCGPSSTMEIAQVASRGSAEELEHAIQRLLDAKSNFLPMIEKALQRLDGNRRSEWRRKSRESILTGSIGCGDGLWLLDFSVGGGNLGLTRYLLDVGADPNAAGLGESDIFKRCDYWASTKEGIDNGDRSRQFAALSLLLERGANLNRADHLGYTAVHKCRTPELVDFYILRGAELNSVGNVFEPFPPLERAVITAIIKSDQPSYSDRAKSIALMGSSVISNERVIRIIRTLCKESQRKTTCNELSAIVRTAPGAFDGRSPPSISNKRSKADS